MGSNTIASIEGIRIQDGPEGHSRHEMWNSKMSTDMVGQFGRLDTASPTKLWQKILPRVFVSREIMFVSFFEKDLSI